ncbi:N-acetylglucosamine/diacetylchitobiose ABC transporter substrate-binding protein [Leifsonia sp. Root112D2]|jgi:N-acetylglucosamine transport system substrate-binding protein|uniref:N-acetylglucosamine/diacetylchitobiose ABC transporter substrate-binding protein n=1 Tax=Leifsonia sp. Root112D2 TaxID=1736426 RepID=UPI0006FFE30D|nr:N-acetylglucosamine/diacetylchitobiose ABC transporter substrate-binding protein [Leifsonia sp. Root112D2]KQV07278.1 sugar ABC transporter sugar-binding protein [Leifsonia sp. Root112D2]
MTIQDKPLVRRDFLRGALAVGIMIPLGGALASCVGGGATTTGPTGKVTATNPFGMVDKSTVDAVIFKGGYGIDYANFAAKQVEKKQPGSTVKVTAQTNIAQTLQPRFVGGNPPDVIDNSGAGIIAINTIRDQLADLTSVVNAKNYEGKVIKDTLYDGVMAPGTFDGKFVQLNYVLTVYAIWYSASLFEANGWTVPKTYDEMLDLGAKAKAKGKYLFGWGKEAATYYQTMAIASAIKEGGDEVRLALENLKPNCWSLPAVQSVFTGLKKIIDAGYVQKGGAGTQFTAAQAQWSNDEKFILYPSGGWIENEMKTQTKADFKMTGAPEPTVTASSKKPWEALHSTAGEGYIVPSQGKNVAGGKEFLRAMLSHDAAVNFAKTTFSSSIVKGTVPDDGFGSTALVSQVKMLEGAGKDVFSWNFVDLYGMNTDQLVLWNTFLQGGSDVKTLTAGLQGITDKIANDSSVKKVTVS